MIENRSDLAITQPRETALTCIEAGIRAAHPERVLEKAVTLDGSELVIQGDRYDLDEYSRVWMLGGGKASEAVASGLEALLEDRIDGGMIVTPDPGTSGVVERLPGDHPVPSDRGVESTHRLLERANQATPGTLVIAPITGGGSALMAAPADPVTLVDLQTLTDSLLESGASIEEINAVRKHLSVIKGGGLARAVEPATVIGLLFSDVVGNDPGIIASGPTAPDPTTFAQASEVLDRYGVDVPETVGDRLQRGRSGGIPDTPGPADPLFDHVENYVVADGFTALTAARRAANERGYRAIILSARVTGEAREAAKTHTAIAEEILATGNPIDPPAVLLSGGETTVTVRGTGYGGPNQEFALQAALAQSGGITITSVDTDGFDGSTDAAGGLTDGTTIDDEGMAVKALYENDAYSYLEERNALVFTGSTETNVNDLRVLVVEAPSNA